MSNGILAPALLERNPENPIGPRIRCNSLKRSGILHVQFPPHGEEPRRSDYGMHCLSYRQEVRECKVKN